MIINWSAKIKEIDSAIEEGNIPKMVKLWRELDSEEVSLEGIPGEEAITAREKIAEYTKKLSVRIIRLLPL